MSYLFVSGWKRVKGSGGLGVYSFDDESGKLSFLERINEDVSMGASFVDRERSILYVLSNERQDVGLKVPSGGAVVEMYFDRESQKFTQSETVPVFISNPCNLSIDPKGRYILIAGHGSRNFVSGIERGKDGEYHPVISCDDVPVMLLSVEADGHIGKILDVVKHEGNGPLAKQQTAHPHCVTFAPSADFFVVCDKGNDSVFSYSIDRAKGKLIRNGDPLYTAAGVCPRYCAFHPTLPYVYHNSETSTDIYSYSYDESGRLTFLGIFKGTPVMDGIKPEPGKDQVTEGQGLNVHPSGRYLYNVTNGTDTIDVFSLGENGSAKLIQSVKIEYAWPRGQIISPDGRFLLLTCSEGGRILVFRVRADGTLESCGCDEAFENAESMSILP